MLVVPHYCRSAFEDVLRGTIVLLQANNFHFGKVALELQNVADVGSAPRVDRLIFVTNHTDVVVLASEQLHQLVLRTVSVLVLVDQDVLVTLVITAAHFGRTLEQSHGLEQQIVKVERIGLE